MPSASLASRRLDRFDALITCFQIENSTHERQWRTYALVQSDCGIKNKFLTEGAN